MGVGTELGEWDDRGEVIGSPFSTTNVGVARPCVGQADGRGELSGAWLAPRLGRWKGNGDVPSDDRGGLR